MSPVRSESAIAGSVGIAADESVVRHSHYYDAAFYRALAETGSVDGRRILERAAATAAFRAMIGSVGVAPDFEVASLFASTGLGAVQKCDFDVEGGSVCLAPSGFVKARLEMFGKSSQPICDISRGVLSGALGAFFGAHFQVKEVECVAMGAKVCRFVARPDRTATTTTLPPFVWGGRGLAPPLDTAVDATAHDLVAQVASGAEIGAGLTPGRLWAEIYGRATHDFEAEIVGGMGAKFTNLASIVLTEAAHLATFYSVGELLRSKGWRQRVAPTIQAREDWAQTIVGLADSYGWGAWRVRLLAPGTALHRPCARRLRSALVPGAGGGAGDLAAMLLRPGLRRGTDERAVRWGRSRAADARSEGVQLPVQEPGELPRDRNTVPGDGPPLLRVRGEPA
jgi:hypothetical protein